MSDYDFIPGSLKLKGDSEGGAVRKKKKKGSKSKPYDAEKVEKRRVKELLFEKDGEDSSEAGTSAKDDRRTEAERRFEEIQKRRLAERVAKLANKTHKDRVSEFNAHLESLSEHHDIPKVGPG